VVIIKVILKSPIDVEKTSIGRKASNVAVKIRVAPLLAAFVGSFFGFFALWPIQPSS